MGVRNRELYVRVKERNKTKSDITTSISLTASFKIVIASVFIF